ncbi:MAG: hypothetical protein K2K70_02290 [Lachnospiraceae bacterium]|nr:hypothetical protein [Lachnospiraceae bacterium]
MSLDNQDYLTKAVTPPPGSTPFPVTSVTWEALSTAAPGASPASYEVKGAYTLNNQHYLVKAKITPRSQLENDDHNTVVYRKAKVPGMDSSKDMIITEKSYIIEDAKTYFYNQYCQYCDDPSNHTSRDPSVKPEEMDQHLQRKIYINAAPEEDETGAKTGKVVLTATYEYQWKSSSGAPPAGITAPGAGVTNPTTYTDKIKVATLDGTGSHNIYLFYTPVNYKSSSGLVTVVPDEVIIGGNLGKLTDGSGKVVIGDPGVGDEELSYHLYLVADGTVDRKDTPAYKATLSKNGTDNFGEYVSTVYTNLADNSELDISGYAINTAFSSVSNSGVHFDELMENPEVNRVAAIEVSVYKDKGDGSMNDDNHYTTVDGTKVQNQ